MTPLALALPVAADLAGSLVKGVANGIGSAVKQARQPAQPATEDTDPRHAKARKTANDFESMFLENMFNYVFQDTGAEGPLGENGTGGGVYKSMMVQEYAKQVAKTGGVGISNQIYDQLIKLQEQSHAAGV
jgi:Rod binding domain-containing protein